MPQKATLLALFFFHLLWSVERNHKQLQSLLRYTSASSKHLGFFLDVMMEFVKDES